MGPDVSFNLMMLPAELILKIVDEVVAEDCVHFKDRWLDLCRYRSTSHLLWETCRFMESEVPRTFSRKFGLLSVPECVKQRAGQSFSELSRGDTLVRHSWTLWAVEIKESEV